MSLAHPDKIAAAGQLRIALLFSEGNFVGREYYAALVESGWSPDLLIAVGAMTEKTRAIEIDRTGGRWNPPNLPEHAVVHRFQRLDDPGVAKLVEASRIDVAIQGGVGILRAPLISTPSFGFVNVHPGLLPSYRGSACPEWAIYEGAAVFATAHVIDEGLDTGPILLSRAMGVRPEWDYYDFRANVYAHCADVLVDALERIEKTDREAWSALAVSQSSAGARTLPRMPAEILAEVKVRFPEWARAHS